uniref:histidine kinase n=1 Tax=Albugo laibachii Nc14 TaxID=890382 RepID=F0WPU4_9STRA|nr:hybrid signal transduction histidine kinase putative [Albugo laibachii Nc14]|eukprot:CCA23345.1 hybrid signal transduction histidine kinase putative [Albugo laibachii Nc14]
MGENLVEEFITNDYKEAVGYVLQKALNGTETANFEFPLITKTGRRVEILLNATPRFNEHGQVMGMVGIGQDITDRIAQEQEYSRLIDKASAPIFGVDVNGCVNIWNRKAVEITQYSTEEVLGEKLVDTFIPDDYRAAVAEVFSDALKGDEGANFEVPLITKTGRHVNILLNATARFDQHGGIVGVVGIGQDITERIAQEQEYTRLIDTANAPIFGVDNNGCVNIWNKKAAEITQYTPSDVMGENLVEKFITDDYKDAVRSVLAKALDGIETANFEFPLITKMGRRVEILLNATSRFNEHGKVMGMVGIGQDITDRIAQEQEYSRLIDTANAPIFGVDANMCVNIWNKKAAQITSYSIAEVMGENLVETFISPEYRPIVADVLSKALKGIQTANFEFPLITRPGTRIEILLNATPRMDSNGTIVGVVGIGQDITDRIAQEHEYFRLIDTANAPIFGVDTIGNINEWNQKIEEITGYSKATVLGLSLVNTFIIPESRQQVRQLLNQALIGVDVGEMELPMTTKQGLFLLLLVNASSKKDMHGNIRGAIGVGQDYTARKQMEAAKVNFLASFSHELRTPLNSVLGMLELLKEKKNLDKNSERHVHMAYVSGSLLLNLINDILDLSKIEAGHMEITAAPFHMHDLLDYSIEIFKFKARERNIILEQKCGKDVPKMVIGDVVRLRQILLNLLSNAIKFTSEGSITVTCNVVLEPSLPPQFKKLLFQVIDTGVGMDAEERSRLFSLFTKLERTRQNNPTGSGLGLAICKQLVQLMDGEIDVDSELNQGSNFYFTVVVRLLDEEQIMLHQNDDALYASDDVVVTDTFAAPLETKTTYTDAMTDKNSVINSNGPGPLSFTVIPSQARILVVEDNEFNWEVVKCYLQEDDHMLQWEVNGRRAVDAYVGHHEEFDMVFMDCEMPVMDGYTATRTIRQFEAQHNLSHMPILGLTAYAMSGDRQKCLDAGMDEFIVKPISKVTLRKAIRQWMRVKYLGIKGPTNSSGLNSNPGSGPTTLTMTTTTTTTTKLSSKPTSDPLKVTTTTTTLYPATSPRLMERIVSPTREPSRSSARMTHQQESEKSSYMRTDASPSCFAPRLMPASRHMQQLDLANAISNLELDNPMAANRYHQAAYSFRPGAPVNSIFSAGSSAHQSSSLRSSLGNTSLQLTWKQSRASIISATLPASFHDGFEEEDSDEEVKDDDREASICSLLTRSSERSDFTGRERISGVRSLERSGTFDRGCGKSRRRRRQIHSGTYPKGNPTLWSHPPFPGKKGTRSRGRRSKVCGMGSGTDFGSQSQGQSQRSDERRLAVDARDKTIPKLSLPERAHDLADTILAVKNRIPQPIVSIVQPTPPVESPPSIMGINPMDIAIPEGDPINFGLGVDQCGGHEELFVSLLKKFAVSCDQIVSRIDTCFQSRDITTMRREAHSLKGSSAYVAALRVSKVAFRLQVGCERVMNAQELAASDDSMTVQRELEVVQSTYDLLKKEHRLLQGYLKRNFAFAGSFTEPSQSADKAAYGEDDEDNANVCALM